MKKASQDVDMGHVPDADAAWWDDMDDDEQDATVAAATTGSWSDYSYLDDEEEDE